MREEYVRLAREDGLARICLARGDAGNALNWELVDQFSNLAANVAADPGVRAVLIESEGRNFCVGGDIRGFMGEAGERGAYLERLAGRLHDGMLALMEGPAPVVVAVQGAAAGAGLSLAISGDLVLAGRSATFTMAYTALGLTADGGATWLLPRLIGLRAAQEMAYTNRCLPATEAQVIGLITGIVDDDRLADEALTLAREVATGPTRAFGAVKRLFAQGGGSSFGQQLRDEASAIGAAMRTRDADEGVRAFMERRVPRFSGE